MTIVSIHRALERAEKRISSAVRVIPHVLDGLDERRAQVGNRLAQENPTHNNDVSDPTGQLAGQLADIELHRQRIGNAARLILHAIDHLDDISRNALGRRPQTEHDPCPGYQQQCDGLPGYEFDTSGSPVTRANRLCDECEDHRKRDDRAAKRAQAERMRRHQPRQIA